MLYTNPCCDPLAEEVVAQALLHLPHEYIAVLLLECVVGRVKQALRVVTLDALARELHDKHSIDVMQQMIPMVKQYQVSTLSSHTLYIIILSSSYFKNWYYLGLSHLNVRHHSNNLIQRAGRLNLLQTKISHIALNIYIYI